MIRLVEIVHLYNWSSIFNISKVKMERDEDRIPLLGRMENTIKHPESHPWFFWMFYALVVILLILVIVLMFIVHFRKYDISTVNVDGTSKTLLSENNLAVNVVYPKDCIACKGRPSKSSTSGISWVTDMEPTNPIRGRFDDDDFGTCPLRVLSTAAKIDLSFEKNATNCTTGNTNLNVQVFCKINNTDPGSLTNVMIFGCNGTNSTVPFSVSGNVTIIGGSLNIVGSNITFDGNLVVDDGIDPVYNVEPALMFGSAAQYVTAIRAIDLVYIYLDRNTQSLVVTPDNIFSFTPFFSYGGFFTISDRRNKTDIRDVNRRNATNIIMGLDVKEYEYTGKGGLLNPGRHIGLIAQDVQQLCPGCVNSINGTLAIDYSNIIPLLIVHNQDLTKDNAILRGHVHDLTTDNAILRGQIASAQSDLARIKAILHIV
jgi:hypothetical protein